MLCDTFRGMSAAWRSGVKDIPLVSFIHPQNRTDSDAFSFLVEEYRAAAKKLEERAGVTVISPAVTPEGLKKADYMRICFAMLESADTAVFLPDWEDSPGAQLEKHWCEYVGKKMVFLMEGAE